MPSSKLIEIAQPTLDLPPTITGRDGEEIWERFLGNLALVRLRPGKSSELHRHDDMTEYYIGLAGLPVLYLEFEGKAKKYNLAPGLMIPIFPKVRHQIWNNPEAKQDAVFSVKCEPYYNPDDVHFPLVIKLIKP